MVTKLASYSAMWNGYLSCLKWVPEFAILWVITPTNFFFNFLISLLFILFYFIFSCFRPFLRRVFLIAGKGKGVFAVSNSTLHQKWNVFSGVFAYLRKATISFVMSVRMEQLGSHSMKFHEIWCVEYFFEKSVEKIKVFWKSYKNNGHVTWKPPTFMISSRILLTVRNVSDKSLQRKSKHTFCAQ